MGQYLPIVVLLVLAVVFARRVSFVASQPARRRSRPTLGQGGALRVRHRARAGSRPSASRCASTSSP